MKVPLPCATCHRTQILNSRLTIAIAEFNPEFNSDRERYRLSKFEHESQIDKNVYTGFIYSHLFSEACHVHLPRQHDSSGLAVRRAQAGSGIIASDEKRHEIAYCRIVAKLFELDPNGVMLSFQEMMKKKIVMPANLMYDGENESLFDDFSSVSQITRITTGINGDTNHM